MSYIFDLRCPRCNCNLKGRGEEVTVIKTAPRKKVIDCKYCNNKAFLKSMDERGIGLMYYYSVSPDDLGSPNDFPV